MIRAARRGWWVAVPAVLGVLALIAIGVAGDDPVVYLRGPLGELLAIAGVLGSLVLAAVFGWHERLTRENRRAAAAAAADRRRLLMRLDHELKHPLTAVQLGLANSTGGREPGAHASRLDRLMTELRKLAELEADHFDQEPVALDALLLEVVATVREQSNTQWLRLRLTLPEPPWELPAVHGDGDLLFLALHTLVANALKFSRPGDAVEIRATEEGEYVLVELADTGPGIPIDELDEVLTNGRAEPGTRLGLPLTHTILTRHGGDAHIRSRVGQGTVVSIRLPTARDHAGL